MIDHPWLFALLMIGLLFSHLVMFGAGLGASLLVRWFTLMPMMWRGKTQPMTEEKLQQLATKLATQSAVKQQFGFFDRFNQSPRPMMPRPEEDVQEEQRSFTGSVPKK